MELLAICQAGNLAGIALKTPALLFNPNTFVPLESGSAVELRNLGCNTCLCRLTPRATSDAKLRVSPVVPWQRTQALLVGSPAMLSKRCPSGRPCDLRGHLRTRASLADAQRFPRARARPDLLAPKRAAERTIRPARRGCRRDARTRGPPTAPGPPSPAGSRGA